MNKKIKRNRIRCKCCGDIIESRQIYDFQQCSCKTVAVDGGLEYAKRIFPSNPAEKFYDELVEYE